jgi:hypothetical protein
MFWIGRGVFDNRAVPCDIEHSDYKLYGDFEKKLKLPEGVPIFKL